MGDYYKIKKILLILIIVLTVIRIFKTSNVFASEAVEVTPTWNDGSYTYLADNQFLTLRQNQIDIQDFCINVLYRAYETESNRTNIKNVCTTILRSSSSWSGNGEQSRFIWFTRFLTGSTECFGYQVLNVNALGSITYNDATLDNGYKILSVPFYTGTRSGGKPFLTFSNIGSQVSTYTTGDYSCPVAEVGVLSTRWLDLFMHVGIISSSDYTSALADLQEISEQNYTQNYYTKQAVQNTYSYLTNDNIEEITSLGISQPQVTEQVDLTDVLDSLEALLTNETYTTKFFTITLPNGRGSTFALSPELLENNLNRVGGQNIVSIIHAVWYIGLYGWYIFSLLGIYGKLLTGDLFHLVKGCSPVTNLVKMSVGTISGGKF